MANVAFVLLALLFASPAFSQQQSRRRRRKNPLRELHASEGPTQDLVWDSGLLEKDLDFATVFEKGE
jgi:hypothetical protein